MLYQKETSAKIFDGIKSEPNRNELKYAPCDLDLQKKKL